MEQSNENEKIISTKNETCEFLFNDVPMEEISEDYSNFQIENRKVTY